MALAALGLTLAALAAYANSFDRPFVFDDFLSIPKNPTLRSLAAALSPPGGGITVTGRPVLNLSLALNHAVSGDAVWSYHAFNLLIHLAAGLALFGIVRRTLARAAVGALRGAATFLGFAAALLWTVHPLQTESVTYVVQRAESLMGLFYLLTLYAFIRGAEFGAGAAPAAAAPAANRARALRWYALSVFACVLGMGTKEVMVSAPVMVLLYDRTFLAGSFREAWRRRSPVYLALAATWVPLAFLVLHGADRGGTAGFGVGIGFWTYLATQFQALAHYLWLSVWPHPLILDYGAQWVRSAGDVVPYAIVMVAVIAATCVAFVRWPALGFLGIWFFAILSPTSLIPGTRQTLAEHRMYLALAPVLVAIVVGLYRWLGRRSALVVGLAAVGLVGLTLQRNAVYGSSAGMWHDTVVKRPGNAAGRNNYANILAEDGRPADALPQYEAAIRLDPTFPDAYYNEGNALKRLGRLPEAIARYEQALKLNPRLPDAQVALGEALEGTGRPEEAMAHFRAAIRLAPKNTDAHNDLGLALADAGRLPDAIAEYHAALAVNPALPEVRNNLGNALRALGRMPEAIAQYQEALQLNPKFAAAHNDLGNAYRELDRQADAIAQYEQALKIDSTVAEVHNNLGISLLMSGRATEAIGQFEQALRLNPSLAQVHINLAIALASTGRAGEADAQLEAARRLGAKVPALPSN